MRQRRTLDLSKPGLGTGYRHLKGCRVLQLEPADDYAATNRISAARDIEASWFKDFETVGECVVAEHRMGPSEVAEWQLRLVRDALFERGYSTMDSKAHIILRNRSISKQR